MEIEAYLKKDYIINLINEGKRIDGRKFDEYRDIGIEKGVVNEKAEGSARVKLGDSEVMVGIKMDVGEPYPDQPDTGVMTVGAELIQLASPTFESGPPREEAIELARVVDRGIRESKAIELDKLLIEENKVWIVFIDVYILNHGGNLIDASGIAATAALLDARMPKYEEGKVIRGEWNGKLPIAKIPIPCTSAKIGDQIVIDPCLDEEYAMGGRLTVATTTTDTDEIMINAMQKGGMSGFTSEEVQKSIDMAFENSKKIRKLVK